MRKVRYVGPFAAVSFPGPDGADITVEQDQESPELPDDLAKSLLEQADNWEAVKADSKKQEKE